MSIMMMFIKGTSIRFVYARLKYYCMLIQQVISLLTLYVYHDVIVLAYSMHAYDVCIVETLT